MTNIVRVRLPPVLRTVTGGAASLEANGETILGALESLARAHPALGLHLFDEAGNTRRNLVCLHRDRAVRAREFAAHAVRAGDELVLTNALAGG